jgi:hypothetical protein
MQKDDFPLYNTNKKINEQRTWTKACKLNILPDSINKNTVIQKQLRILYLPFLYLLLLLLLLLFSLIYLSFVENHLKIKIIVSN